MSGIFIIFMFEAFLPKITQNLHQGFKTKLLYKGEIGKMARGDNFGVFENPQNF